MNKHQLLENRIKWIEYVNKWKASGLSPTEFSNKEKINVKSFRNWIWKLKNQKIHNDHLQNSTPLQFIEIGSHNLFNTSHIDSYNNHPNKSQAPPFKPEPFDVILKNGLNIRVPVCFDSSSLRLLIDTLEK